MYTSKGAQPYWSRASHQVRDRCAAKQQKLLLTSEHAHPITPTAKAIGYLIANGIAPSITFFFDKIAYPDGYHFCLSYQNGYLNGYHFFA